MPNTQKKKQRKGPWPATADYIRVPVDEAKRLIKQDVAINGLKNLLAHSYFSNATMTRGIDSMDDTNLILALKVGIERNAVVEADDPKRLEKAALREKQIALFGDLELTIPIHVGHIATFITPVTTKQ
jgi:hypothetical protein